VVASVGGKIVVAVVVMAEDIEGRTAVGNAAGAETKRSGDGILGGKFPRVGTIFARPGVGVARLSGNPNPRRPWSSLRWYLETLGAFSEFSLGHRCLYSTRSLTWGFAV